MHITQKMQAIKIERLSYELKIGGLNTPKPILKQIINHNIKGSFKSLL